MSEKLKAVRGNEKHPEIVREWLKEHGAEGSIDLTPSNDDLIYSVAPDGTIHIFGIEMSYLFDIVTLPTCWRAREGTNYFYINAVGDIEMEKEYYDDFDNSCYEWGNYFKTRDEAWAMREKICKLLSGEK